MNIVDYLYNSFFSLTGVEPLYIRVFCIPCELFFGIYPRVFLHSLTSGDKIQGAIEVGKHFLKTHGVERIVVAQVVHAPCLLLKTSLHHGIYTAVDAVEKFGALHVESDFHDAKRPLFLVACAKRGVGFARLSAHF